VPQRPHEESSDAAGILNLYKPVGKSSANYVYRLRPIFGLRKVGHAGTLDPFADGVLLACIGQGTRLVERLMELPKRYRTTIRLGVTNETFDTEREATPVEGAMPAPREAVEAVVRGMVGVIEQTPPLFSAMRVGGRPSYKLAKQGKAKLLQSRPITVYRMAIDEYVWPLLRLDITCGRGTYIRAIARDIGEALACGGICEQLCRASIGPFHVGDAVRLDRATPDEVRAALISVSDAIERVEEYVLPTPASIP
jgi:tRNA pseudouridine55 synthase